MLSKEVMGALALAILWVNVLLIAAAAAKQAAALLRRRAALAGVVRGRVTRGAGPGGALAAYRVEQVGRAAGEDDILFHDRRAAGEVFGGVVAPDGGEPVTVVAAASAEVWLDAEALSLAGACPSASEFARAHASARKVQGFDRTVVATVGEGAEVYVSPRGDVLVATMDPRALLARKAALSAAFVAGEILAAAACTTLALWPPRFGLVSIAGAALSLGFFLGVQPAGTAVRDAVLVPSRAFLRGRWSRPSAAPIPSEA